MCVLCHVHDQRMTQCDVHIVHIREMANACQKCIGKCMLGLVIIIMNSLVPSPTSARHFLARGEVGLAKLVANSWQDRKYDVWFVTKSSFVGKSFARHKMVDSINQAIKGGAFCVKPRSMCLQKDGLFTQVQHQMPRCTILS